MPASGRRRLRTFDSIAERDPDGRRTNLPPAAAGQRVWSAIVPYATDGTAYVTFDSATGPTDEYRLDPSVGVTVRPAAGGDIIRPCPGPA
jgi:hypothetical protein